MKKWTLVIIQASGKYRAILLINNKEIEDLPRDVNYKVLSAAIKEKTGIQIPKRKEMIFERLSDFEKVATIDATQCRANCRVTIQERKNGWKPNWEL